MNNDCTNAGFTTSVVHLARDPLDHALLLLSAQTRLDNKPRPFLFNNVWVNSLSFLEMVNESWKQDCVAPPIRLLGLKLKRLKQDIQQQNKNCFGNIQSAVLIVEEKLAQAERRL